MRPRQGRPAGLEGVRNDSWILLRDEGAGGLTDRIARCPADEIHGYHYRLLGLAGDVPRDERHGESLCRPETEDYVVGEQKSDLSCLVGVLDCHEDDGADEGSVRLVKFLVLGGEGGLRNDINPHDENVLLESVDQPHTAHENDDDVYTENHGQ